MRDGSVLNVNFVAEGLDVAYDEETHELVITSANDTEQRIPIADLVKDYAGSNGTHIQITVESGNIITAILKKGSIDEEYLMDELQGRLDTIEQSIGSIHTPDVSGFVKEASDDGSIYARQNEAWVVIDTDSFFTTEQAEELEERINENLEAKQEKIDDIEGLITTIVIEKAVPTGITSSTLTVGGGAFNRTVNLST
jgi:NAD-specific glutamate dehydrogenase